MTLVAGWMLWSHTGAASVPQVTHLEMGVPDEVEPYPGTSMAPVISPDGRSVAMVGVKNGVRHVFTRRLDRGEANELLDAGGQGAIFSPDSQSRAVLSSSGVLTRVSLADQQDAPAAPGLSPDGKTVALMRSSQEGRNVDIWFRDVQRGILRRFTADPGVDGWPIWSPDGRRIMFYSTRTGSGDLFERPTGGATEERPVLTSPERKEIGRAHV